MSNPQIRDRDISKLHPAIRDNVAKIQAKLKAEKIPFEVFEAFRTPERQAWLYAQGRTRKGNKVTWARPWSSIHQYGLAVDFVLKPGKNWSWETTGKAKAWWPRMHEIAAEHDMAPIRNSKGQLIEMPHVQFVGTSSSKLKRGQYPNSGDADWAEYLSALIDGWKGPGAAPPHPPSSPRRPPLDADAIAEMEETHSDDAADAPVLKSAATDAKFQKLFSFVRQAEAIPGAGNNFGIDAAKLAHWHNTEVSQEDIAALSQGDIADILRTHVYMACRCADMPDRTAMVVFNAAVMSGQTRAVETLQNAFNAMGMTVRNGADLDAPGQPLDVDGDIGPNTIAAAKETDAQALSEAYLDQYMTYLKNLDSFETRGAGWTARVNSLREFLEDMPQGAGKRPKTIMKVSDNRFDLDIDKDDLLRLALLGATGGKSALAKAVLGKALARKAKESVLESHGKELLEGLLEDRLGLDIDTETAEAAKKLTPVNAALGESVGKLLDGKKSVIGILGLVSTVILPELGLLSPGAEEWLVGKVGAVQEAGNQTTMLTLLSIFTGWGFLGKIDKAIRETK